MDGTVPWLALCSTRPMDEIRTAPSLLTVSLKRACAAPEDRSSTGRVCAYFADSPLGEPHHERPSSGPRLFTAARRLVDDGFRD